MRDMDTDMTPQQQKEQQSNYPAEIYPQNGPSEQEAIDMGCWYGQSQASALRPCADGRGSIDRPLASSRHAFLDFEVHFDLTMIVGGHF